MRSEMAPIQEMLDERIGLGTHQKEACGSAHDRTQLHPHVPFSRRQMFGFEATHLVDYFRHFIDANEVELFALHLPERVNTYHEARRMSRVETPGQLGRSS